jgi:hopanoid biosynthesis associated RND transporter like protein HpnN
LSGDNTVAEIARDRFERFLVAWVDGARRMALLVVLLAVAATAGLGYYAVNNMGMNTSTEDMLSPELPFRQRQKEFKAVFPQLSNSIVAVIDGANIDLAEDAAQALEAKLRDLPDLFRQIYRPGGSDYFVQNGLLYLDTEELGDLADRLADAQPLLTDLAQDPSLRGFFGVLGLAADEIADGAEVPAGLVDVFERVSESIEARSAGAPGRLSWSELMRGGDISAEDRRRFIIIWPKLDFSQLQPAGPAMAAVRTAGKELGFGADSGVRLRLTGSSPYRHEELESVKNGAGLAGIISLGLVTGLLVWGLGSATLVIATLLTLIAGLVWTAAFAAFAVGHLNLISVAFTVLFIGLGVDFGIHFCLRYREAAVDGAAHAEALRRAAGGVGGALTLATAAAAIGFFSFLPTAFVGVSELGLISGGGMFIALFANLTLLPALLSMRPAKLRSGHGVRLPTTAFEGLIERRARVIVWGALLLGIAALAAVPSARFDLDPLKLRDPATESVQTALELEQEAGRVPYTIDILADDMAAAAALAGRLEALPEVDEALTLHDFVPKHQDEKLDIIDEAALFLSALLMEPEPVEPPSAAERRQALAKFRTKLDGLIASDGGGPAGAPARRLSAAFAQFEAGASSDADYRALESAMIASLPKRLAHLRRSLSAGPVTLDDLPEDLRSRRMAADGRARIEVYAEQNIRDPVHLHRFVDAVRELAPEATDTPVVIVEAGNAVVAAFQQATLSAVVLIALLLLVLLRNVRDAAFVLAPLALAAVLTVATTVLLDMPFNFANVIVLPLLLGLGVASGVHLMLRYRRDAGAGQLLRTSTPRAVMFRALTTVGSFGSLAISSHRGTASMGLLLTIALLYTLVCSLVVLPAMLKRRAARQAEGSASA